MMKNLTVAFMTCSAVENDAAGNACWFQTTPPYGRYPGRNQITGKDGKPIKDAVVVFDEKSVGKVVAAFKEAAKAKDWPGILVDQDHFSCNTSKPSTALAWARDIRVDGDGSIWTKWEFTAKGKELYEGKMLINRSPVLDLEQLSAKEFAPTVLTSIGMTNAPYFKDLSPLAAAREKGQEVKHEKLTDAQMSARCKNWGLMRELAVFSDGYFDEAKHPRAEDGKFTDGVGGGSAKAADDDKPGFDFGEAMKKKRKEMNWDYNNPDHWNAALQYRHELAKSHPKAQAAYDAKHKLMRELAAKRK